MAGLRSLFSRMSDTVGVIVGASSYQRYCEHMAAHHPEQAPMTRGAFFNARQDARYGGKNGGRCC